MADSDEEYIAGAPNGEEGPDQVEKLNKNLLMAFKQHLEKGDMLRIPKNHSLDDSDDDEAWAQNDAPEDEAARREIIGALRTFVQEKIAGAESVNNTKEKETQQEKEPSK
jgi:hypothetical protein